MSHWIFQANPKHYDIDAALARLDQIVWRVPQYTDQVRAGDTVAIWRSGKEAGIVGLGTVLTDPALAAVAAAEAEFVRDELAEGRERTRVVLATVPVAHVPKAAVAAIDGMTDHPIIRAPRATVYPVSESQWQALTSKMDDEPHNFEPPVRQPGPYPAPFGWNDRRKETFPLPGGYEGYLVSLRRVLDFVAEQRPSVDELTTDLQESLGTSATNARHITLFLRRVGFVVEVAGLLEVSREGDHFLRTGDGPFVVAQLHARVRFIGEMLRLLDQPRSAEELREMANQLFDMGWTTKAQIDRRRGWLQSAGLVAVDDEGRLALTAAGRTLSTQLVCHDPLPVPEPEPSSVASAPSGVEAPVQELVAPEVDVVELVRELEASSTASDSPDDFEFAIRNVFDYLGFRAEKLGGAGKTDVVADADLGMTDSYRIIIDAKTSGRGAVSDQQIDWDTIDDHRRLHDADYVVIAAPTFAGDRTRARARDHSAVLLTAADLADLVRQHAGSPLGLDAYRSLFAAAGGDADLELLTDSVEARDRLIAISQAVLDEIEAHVSEVGALSARDLFLLLRSSSELDAAEPEIVEVLTALASPLLALLVEVDGGYRPAGPRSTGIQRLSILSGLLAGRLARPE